MDNTPHHTGLEARIAGIITPTLEAMGYELVRVQVMGKTRPTVQIMADRADGSQIAVEDCEAISHAVGAVLDVEDPISNAWSLEISSAGIDRPLTRLKDWQRFAGHLARVDLSVPMEGRKRFQGTILEASADTVQLRLTDGTHVALAADDIHRAKLVLTDALIEATQAQPARN